MLRKAKKERVFLKFGIPDKKENFWIVCFDDISLGNLKDGRSQGGFIIYIVGNNNICSPTIWQSKTFWRIAKSTMTAEALVQVDSAKSCFWLANLRNDILYPNSNKETLAKTECRTDNHQVYVIHSIKLFKIKG